MVKLRTNGNGRDLQPEPWRPENLTDWMERVRMLPDPEWIIPRLLPYDATVLITGRAKVSWKTWLAFHTVLCATTGKSRNPLWKPDKTVKAIIIEMEDPAKQTLNRWETLMKGLGISEEEVRENVLFVHREHFVLQAGGDLERLCELVQWFGAKLVVLDTLAMVNPNDENKVHEMARTLHCILSLKQAMQGGTVMLLHHLRKENLSLKAEEDIDAEIRGSSSIAGFYDVHWAIRKPQQFDDYYYTHLSVRQSGDEQTHYQIQWVYDKQNRTCTPIITMEEPDKITREQLLEYTEQLKAQGEGTGFTLATLRRIWGKSEGYSKKVRTALLEDDTLKMEGKKVYLQ